MLKLFALGFVLAAVSLLGVQSNYVISGSVSDNAGRAACGVRVCVLAPDFAPSKPNFPIPCSMSDTQGRFNIAVSKAGSYKIFYDYASQGYLSTYLPFFRNPSFPLQEVNVDDSNVRASVTVTMLPKNGLIVGTSVDASTGLPVENVEFIMCHAAHKDVCWQTNARNTAGRFRLPAAHVPFTLRARAEGYDDWLGPGGGDSLSPISVVPETKVEFNVSLKRSAASSGRALTEAEKQTGVNLPAPAQTSPADGAVFDYYPRTTKLEWSPVEGAVSYGIEIDYCSGKRQDRSACIGPQPLKMMNNPATTGINGNTYEFIFVGAQPGRWRVWAVDREGREGFKSPWRRFVYLQ